MTRNLEAEFAEKVMSRLRPYFDTRAEQWSRTGADRIDFLLKDKVHGKYFGIEFKPDDYKRGDDLGKHVLQSMRYAAAEWFVGGEWRHLPIMICPPISYTYLMCPNQESKIVMNDPYGKPTEFFCDRHPKDHNHHTANGLLGGLGVGEIRTKVYRDKQYMNFVFSNRTLWDERPAYGTNQPIGVNLKNYEIQTNKEIRFQFR
jgi:hypothetical protein